MKKIVIVGPGAMGCLLAGLLIKAGNVVSLLDYLPDRCAADLTDKGLRVETGNISFTVPIKVVTDANKIGYADFIIICVKAFDTQKAAEEVSPCVDERRTLVLTLQNGLGNVEILSSVLGSGHVVGGITAHGATLREPGSVVHTGVGDTIIGSLLSIENDDRLLAIKKLLDKAGINTTITSELTNVLWSKLIINSAINPLAALTRLKNGELLNDPNLADLLERVASEGQRVATEGRMVLLYPDMAAQVKKVCQETSENTNSMLADILRGRRTEICEINGAIVEIAEQTGVSAPLNAVLLALVKGLEESFR